MKNDQDVDFLKKYDAMFKKTHIKQIFTMCAALAFSSLGSKALASQHTTYMITNAQGTVVAEMDQSGAVTYTEAYKPYGEKQSGAIEPGPGFTGHVHDPETDLVYMQARYYDPNTGRFLSTDPDHVITGNYFTFNRYTYADNNPINKNDPTGKTCKKVKGSYSCQIDALIEKNGKKITRKNFSHHMKSLVRKFEKNYTKAVNYLAKHPNKSTSINVKNGGPAQTITAGFLAQTLAKRTMIAYNIPGNGIGAQTALLDADTTFVYQGGLSGKRTDNLNITNHDELIRIELTHEGIHGTYVDKTKGSLSMSDWQTLHQKPYDNASLQLLGIHGD